MSAHMKGHHTDNVAKVVIEIPKQKQRIVFVPVDKVDEVEAFLKKKAHIEIEDSIEWKLLAQDRIEKYKKSGIVLRGARYRENLSQKELAKKSKVTQDNISKMENGKRVVGEKVARRLARVLNIDYKLLLE